MYKWIIEMHSNDSLYIAILTQMTDRTQLKRDVSFLRVSPEISIPHNAVLTWSSKQGNS